MCTIDELWADIRDSAQKIKDEMTEPYDPTNYELASLFGISPYQHADDNL